MTTKLASVFRWLMPCAALLCLLLAAHWHFQLALVVGDSMLPGLKTGDLLLVRKRAYLKSEPSRGDIVLARRDHEFLVKRVIGLPGEEVALTLGHIYINGSPMIESYPVQSGSLTISSGRLYANKFALLGDNRALDGSQTVHAVLAKQAIAGRVIGAIRFSALNVGAVLGPLFVSSTGGEHRRPHLKRALRRNATTSARKSARAGKFLR